MKKWLLAILCILALGIILIYVFIPAQIIIKKTAPVTVTQEGIIRFLSSPEGWKRSWPGTIEQKNGIPVYSYDGYTFQVKKVLYNSIELSIENSREATESILFVLPYQMDSLDLQWAVTIHAGNNPYTRLQQYLYANKIGKSIENILKHLSVVLSKTETIYDLDIRKEKVPFQHFLATKTTFDHYPSLAEIYQLIGGAKEFVAKAGASQTDPPILNIKTEDSIHYETQVAIPIDKDIPGNEMFAHKWMMKGGNILSADVPGGPETIKKAYQQMSQYIIDYRRSNIAIPFQLLITDRLKETDTTKWRTRIYYPVV
jgi:hypothetical protein